MKRLYVVRHGESKLNVARIFAGRTDTLLTDTGREQARQSGIACKDFGINRIVASPLGRAIETAQIIADEIGYSDEILINGLVTEQALGSIEGTSWDTEPDWVATEGVESETELTVRAANAVEFLQNLPDDTVLLVSHGTFIRYLQASLAPGDSYEEPHNAEILQLLPLIPDPATLA